jgi:hypothetical protein
MQNPNQVMELEPNGGFISAFNAVYPMLVSAFNTAMGDQSLGVSAGAIGKFDEKTATEVQSLAKQQNNRDQYNQLYLGEFLKDIMMLWLSNNKQFLFDDPTNKYQILKIVGKDEIQELQQLHLDDTDIPDYAMREISQTVLSNPGAVDNNMLQGIVSDVSVPKNPVILNPTDKPENYKIKKKLNILETGAEAELYITPEDFVGEYDYIPDVKSMSAGAGTMMQQARQKAYELILTNPNVTTLLQTQGQQIKIKDLLVNILEDAGDRDADGMFQPIQNGQPGQTGVGPGGLPPGANGNQGIPGVPPSLPPQPGPGGVPGPAGIQQAPSAPAGPPIGLHP